MKRILAWMGLAYMALLMGAQMYFMFCGGTLLYSWGGLLACPACAGAFALGVMQRRSGEWSRSRSGLLMAASAVAFFAFLFIGLSGLLTNF